MNWDYIAGFFDGEGNVHLHRIKNSTYCIFIRIYQTSDLVLEEIRKFIGYGKIYQKRLSSLNRSGLFELNFNKKENVKNFLLNIKDKVMVKKEQISYLLDNYSFEKGTGNSNFDVDKFRSFITRKNVDEFRTYHTIIKPI